jgi:hypothetical protein
MEQLADGRERIDLLDRLVAMDRLVTERVDDARLVEDRFAGDRFEARVVDQRAEIVLIGQTQCSVRLVGPRDRKLQRAAGVEARRARVWVSRSCRFVGGLVNAWPFSVEEREGAGNAQLLSLSLGGAVSHLRRLPQCAP